MKNKAITYIILSAATVLFFGCGQSNSNSEFTHSHTHEDHHEHNHGHDHEGHNHHDGEEEHEHDDDAIKLKPEQAEKLGVIAEEIILKPFEETIKVGGELTAPASARHAIIAKTNGIVSLKSNASEGSKVTSGSVLATVNGKSLAGGDVSEALRIEYQSAKQNLDRLEPLYRKGVISQKEYLEAKTIYDKAKAAMGSVSGDNSSIVSPASGTILELAVSNGDYVTAGQTIGYVGDNTLLTFKADLPKRLHSKYPHITDAFIIPSCDDCDGFSIQQSGGNKLNGNSSVNNIISGFIPVYFTFPNNGKVDGSGYVEAYLILNNNVSALSVPKSALFEQQGQWFVFVKLDEDCYEKRPVTIGGMNGKEVAISKGVAEGEKVVIQGTTFVRLAENANVIPEGHSHSH